MACDSTLRTLPPKAVVWLAAMLIVALTGCGAKEVRPSTLVASAASPPPEAGASSDTLAALLSLPPTGRPPDWTSRVRRTIAGLSLVPSGRGAHIGPDGHGYLDFQPAPPETPGAVAFVAAIEPAIAACRGVTLNARDDGADWVFSLGDLLAYRFEGGFFTAPLPGSTSKVLTEAVKVLTYQPSEALFPAHVRACLRDWLRDNLGIEGLGIVVMVNPGDTPPRTLMVDVHRLSSEQQEAFRQDAQHVAWFVPTLMPLGSGPKDLGFEPL